MKSKTNSLELPNNNLLLQWKDITVTRDGKNIIDNVSGHLISGELIGVLGPSGCGKTTLLHAISKQIEMQGEVSLNETPIEDWGSTLAFVSQKDVAFEHQTVFEVIDLASKFRGGKVQTMDILEQLGLERCKDTFCKSISGGQLKRVCIARALVANPRVLFLDEPLSGLDSYAAAVVVEHLENLARQGRIVCMTLHQPSSHIGAMYDQFMVLKRGSIFCHGTLDEITSLAKQNGQPCPEGQQVLDHVLFLLGKDAERPSWNDCPLLPRNIEEISEFAIDARKKSGCNKRCLQEMGLLLKREFKETFRAKRQVLIELCVMLFTSMFVSIMFWGNGDVEKLNEHFVTAAISQVQPDYFDTDDLMKKYISSVNWSGMFVAIVCGLFCFPELVDDQRSIAETELNNGSYYVLNFFFTKLIKVWMKTVLYVLIFYSINFKCIRITGSWGTHFTSCLLMTLSFQAVNFSLAAMAKTKQVGYILFTLVLLPNLVASMQNFGTALGFLFAFKIGVAIGIFETNKSLVPQAKDMVAEFLMKGVGIDDNIGNGYFAGYALQIMIFISLTYAIIYFTFQRNPEYQMPCKRKTRNQNEVKTVANRRQPRYEAMVHEGEFQNAPRENIHPANRNLANPQGATYYV